jgi:plastocyanin
MRRMTLVIASLLVLVAAIAAPLAVQAGGGCHGGETPPGDGSASVVKIDGCMFYPTVARVPVGTTVTFLNSGEAPHNVTGVSGAWFSGDLATGARFQHRFAEAGVYPFACTLHPGMNGAIVVGDAAADAPAAAQLATSAMPTPDQATTPDVVGLAAAGLAGFAIGALLVAIGSRFIASRPRTTV